jgi:hypothetical protein
MAELRVTELEFEEIKQNLIRYLSNQDEFSDYNYTGSALNILIDLLAYNTHYNAMLTHLTANEMFIDTAVKRSSVVSIAKTLGYVPRSFKTSTAKVDILVAGSTHTGPLTLPAFTKFTTNVIQSSGNVKTFSFVNLKAYTTNKIGGVYNFQNVELYEGSIITQTDTVGYDTVSGPFIMGNPSVDIETISVSVIENSTTYSYKKSTSIVDLKPDQRVFFVEEGSDGFYRIIFGDDIIGKKLEIGNTVSIRYIASQGSVANGANTFNIQSTLGGVDPVVQLVASSAGGSEKEGTDSIRKNAVRFNATRNRAVTVDDYKTLILNNFGKAKAVTVWGGENNIPAIYGKVFISIDPKENYLITQSDKDYILNSIVKPRSVMSILHEFVDPVRLYVGMNVNVEYNALTTTFSPAQIASNVNQQITNYFANEVSTLDKTFYYAQLINKIQTSHKAILGTLIDLTVQRRFIPILNVAENLEFYFTTSIDPNSFRSTNFKTVLSISGKEENVYIQDFANGSVPSKTGTGILKLLRVSDNSVVIHNYGTIHYGGSGLVSIPNFVVTELLGTTSDIRFTAIPQDLGKNISPTLLRTTEVSNTPVYPYPSQNIIITLDDSETNANIGSMSGLTVIAQSIEI